MTSVTGTLPGGGTGSLSAEDPDKHPQMTDNTKRYSEGNPAEEKGKRDKKYRKLDSRKKILQSKANKNHDGDINEALEYKLTFKVPKGAKNKKEYLKAKTEEMAHLLGAKVKGKAEEDEEQQSGGGGGGGGGAPLNQYAQAAAQTISDALNYGNTPMNPYNSTNPDPNPPASLDQTPKNPINTPTEDTIPPANSENFAVEVLEAGPGTTTLKMNDGSVQKRTGDRNWRNHNPGNMEYGDFSKSKGAIGTDGRFAVFPSYNAGREAMRARLFDTSLYNSKTIAGAITLWAPPRENNTARYISEVAGALGVPASTPMSSLTPNQQQQMIDAMQQVEGFRAGKINNVPAGSTPAPGTGGGGAAPDSTPLGRFPDNKTIYNYDQVPSQLSPEGTFRTVDPALKSQLGNDAIMRDVASAMYGEAGSSFMGRVAVASNIINRAQQGNWPGGKNMAEVARAPQQYVGYSGRRAANLSDAQLSEAKSIISGLVNGQLEDPTLGATSFRSSQYIMSSSSTAHQDAANDPNSIAMGQTSSSNRGNTYFRKPDEIARGTPYILNPQPGTFIPGRTVK